MFGSHAQGGIAEEIGLQSPPVLPDLEGSGLLGHEQLPVRGDFHRGGIGDCAGGDHFRETEGKRGQGKPRFEPFQPQRTAQVQITTLLGLLRFGTMYPLGKHPTSLRFLRKGSRRGGSSPRKSLRRTSTPFCAKACDAPTATFHIPFAVPRAPVSLTGRYQQRFGHESNRTCEPDHGKLGLPIEQGTVAQAMKRAGYATGAVGTRHLGAALNFHPNRRGLDEYFGLLGGGRL